MDYIYHGLITFADSSGSLVEQRFAASLVAICQRIHIVAVVTVGRTFCSERNQKTTTLVIDNLVLVRRNAVMKPSCSEQIQLRTQTLMDAWMQLYNSHRGRSQCLGPVRIPVHTGRSGIQWSRRIRPKSSNRSNRGKLQYYAKTLCISCLSFCKKNIFVVVKNIFRAGLCIL